MSTSPRIKSSIVFCVLQGLDVQLLTFEVIPATFFPALLAAIEYARVL
jgi:hypothetical protein